MAEVPRLVLDEELARSTTRKLVGTLESVALMVQAGGIQVAPQRAAEIRDSVLDELRGEREQAAADRARASQRLATLTSERKAGLQAHYAGALPLDLLKEEMDRLTQDMATAERVIKNSSTTVDELEATLQAALAVAGNCHQRYAQAPPHVRRQLNQGFFTKLFIARDGSVERAELTEPFASLMDHEVGAPDWQTGGGAQNVLEGLDIVRTTETPPLPPDGARGVLGRDRHCSGNVLVSTLGNDLEHTHGDLVTVGSKEAGLVPAVGFEPTLSTS